MGFGKAIARKVPARLRGPLGRLRDALIRRTRLSREERVARILELATPIRERQGGWVEMFKALEAGGLHCLPVHFYSPVPDTRELARHRDRWWKESDFGVVRYDLEEEARLNGVFAAMQCEFAALPSAGSLMAKGLGLGYGEIEAQLLHGFIRHFKPRRVIEVGCGVSTFYTSNALALNGKEGRPGSVTCIEPHPSEDLKTGAYTAELRAHPVQDVELSFFQQLEANDILFIDSSHAVKVGSDVNYLLLDVVPSLKPGVLVHVHDIPFPYVTPREYWIFDRAMFWQEAVLLKALLTHNHALEIVYCASFQWFKRPEALKAAFPIFDCDTHFPSSVWLRKTA